LLDGIELISNSIDKCFARVFVWASSSSCPVVWLGSL
jgi:hypothetical protein